MTKKEPKKVVIVDDAQTMRSVLRGVLTHAGFNVVGQSNSGNGLLESVRKLMPDIICLDYNMPGEDGVELLRQIHEQYPAIAVIMITGDESPEVQRQAIKVGASGFIHKPFTPENIINEVRQVANTQDLLKTTLTDVKSGEKSKSQLTAVVADDSNVMRMLLVTILAKANVKVVGQACNGKEAIEMFIEHDPDFICLDIEMPEINGLDAFKEIQLRKPASKVLIISSSGDRVRVIEAVKMGAKGYIKKPFQPAQIIEAVSGL